MVVPEAEPNSNPKVEIIFELITVLKCEPIFKPKVEPIIIKKTVAVKAIQCFEIVSKCQECNVFEIVSKYQECAKK